MGSFEFLRRSSHNIKIKLMRKMKAVTPLKHIRLCSGIDPVLIDLADSALSCMKPAFHKVRLKDPDIFRKNPVDFLCKKALRRYSAQHYTCGLTRSMHSCIRPSGSVYFHRIPGLL